MSFEPTAVKLWKRLTPEGRLAAAAAFWKEPGQELLPTALGAVVRARRLRPQVARSLPPDELARITATVMDPGEALAAGLLVALHLGARRPLLVTFLDAVGLAHEEGLLKEEPPDTPPLDAATARAGWDALRAAHGADDVRVYLNTLWLQDPERWAALSQPPLCD